MVFQSLGFKRKATPFIVDAQLHLQADSISDLCEAEGKLSFKSDIISAL